MLASGSSRAILAVVLLTSLATSGAFSSPQYRITDIGTLGGPTSHAWAINAAGEVIGYSDTGVETHAFIWSPEDGLTDLLTLGGDLSHAYGINDLGEVVGYSRDVSGLDTAFRWTDTAGMVPLPTLDAASGAYAINSPGQVVGNSRNSDGKIRAVLWDGTVTDLGTLGGDESWAKGINASARVVGFSDTASGYLGAFEWTSATGIQLLPTMAAGDSEAWDIADSGHVVGFGNTGTAAHAMMWDLTKAPTDLGSLGVSSWAYGVNESLQVVGASFVAGAAENHAFVWDEMDGMRDLNDLIAPGSGWVLERSTDINDAGMIVGYGWLDGETRAYLATPTPELSSGALLLVGMLPIGIAWWRRRRA